MADQVKRKRRKLLPPVKSWAPGYWGASTQCFRTGARTFLSAAIPESGPALESRRFAYVCCCGQECLRSEGCVQMHATHCWAERPSEIQKSGLMFGYRATRTLVDGSQVIFPSRGTRHPIILNVRANVAPSGRVVCRLIVLKRPSLRRKINLPQLIHALSCRGPDRPVIHGGGQHCQDQDNQSNNDKNFNYRKCSCLCRCHWSEGNAVRLTHFIRKRSDSAGALSNDKEFST